MSDADRNKYKITDKLKQTLDNESPPVATAFPNNKEELIFSFNQMRDWTKQWTNYFLQFVGHGCEYGIKVGSEIVAWKDLAEHLEEVNALSNNTLLFNMSTCKGINAVKATASDGKHPFLVLLVQLKTF